MLWSIIIFLIALSDQISKYLISENIRFGERISIIDNFFYLANWSNKGAAWGIMQNSQYFLISITFVISALLLYYLIKSNSSSLSLSISFILGGALGNLIDRIFKGGVIDFLDFYLGSYHFPTFNVADSFIVVGTFIFAYHILFYSKN